MALIGDPHGDAVYLRGLKGVFRDPADQQRYIRDGMERIQVVLRTVEGLRSHGIRRILELGANPYVMTLLLLRRLGREAELCLANYFGHALTESEGTQSAILDDERIDFPFQHFNIERDPFPYAAASFDCVLFCEILEHLLTAPDFAVAEIARVLKPEGFVVVSTPNATRLPNLFSLAQGRSIWDGYSKDGPYGRHNREFALHEVHDLLTHHGFAIHASDVRNVEQLARRYTWLQWLRPCTWNQHLFVVGRKR